MNTAKLIRPLMDKNFTHFVRSRVYKVMIRNVKLADKKGNDFIETKTQVLKEKGS